MERRWGLVLSLAAAMGIFALWLAQRDGTGRSIEKRTHRPTLPAGARRDTGLGSLRRGQAPGSSAIEDPATEDDPPEPEIVLPGASPADDTRFVWRLLGERVGELMADGERFPELQQCRHRGDHCLELEAEALRKVLTWPIVPELAQSKHGVRSLLAKHETSAIVDAAYETASQVLTSSAHDGPSRVVALALLERVLPEAPDMPPRALPEGAYDGLIERSPAEANLLLRVYESAPTGSRTTPDAIRALALDSNRSPELRGQAIRALGHAQTSVQLSAVVGELLRNGEITQSFAENAVAPALARCASACANVFARLGASHRTADMMAALMAVAMTKDPAAKAELLDLVVQALPAPESLDPLARDQLAYLTSRVGPAQTQ